MVIKYEYLFKNSMDAVYVPDGQHWFYCDKEGPDEHSAPFNCVILKTGYNFIPKKLVGRICTQ